jgi:hypothetical protein
VAGEAVAAAAHGNLESVFGRKGDGPGYVLGVGRPHDRRRAAVPVAIEDQAVGVIARVVGADHPSLDRIPEAFEIDYSVSHVSSDR